MPEHSQHRMGIALVTAAAVAWSTAPFFTRLVPFDSWTILFRRGLFGGSFILTLLLVTQGRTVFGDIARMGGSGWLVAALSTLGMVAFIPALQLTSVANVAVINAAGPFAAAGLAWLWLRERVRVGTLAASLVAFAGVAIIVSNAAAGPALGGIGLASLMTLAIAGMTVVIRRCKHVSMVAAAGMSNFLGSVVSVPFANAIWETTGPDLVIFAAFGFLQVGMGLTLFVLGSRHLPSAQSSLIATLETPLMPFWVWVAFQEKPAVRALVGGTLVLSAVIGDIFTESRSQRTRSMLGK
jgi:drug/metabolite transporter (DMT)-like permease